MAARSWENDGEPGVAKDGGLGRVETEWEAYGDGLRACMCLGGQMEEWRWWKPSGKRTGMGCGCVWMGRWRNGDVEVR